MQPRPPRIASPPLATFMARPSLDSSLAHSSCFKATLREARVAVFDWAAVFNFGLKINQDGSNSSYSFITTLMSHESHLENSEHSPGEFTLHPDNTRSPQRRSQRHRLFYSPFHVAEFSEAPRPETSSPDFMLQFSNSFKRIIENEKEESPQNREMFDIMGHRINEFTCPADPDDSPEAYFPVIEEDKENEHLPIYIKTPLKLERKEIRSPLEDITPSMTHKKLKTTGKFTEKRMFLTPRTMEKSGLASSGLGRIDRF